MPDTPPWNVAPRITGPTGVVGPVDASLAPRFAGIATFARLPTPDEVTDVDVAVLGIPFDSGVSYRPGARFGPASVREASRLLRPYNPALGVETFRTIQIVDAGDLAVSPFSIADAVAAIELGARRLADRARTLVSVGGDHTVTLPLLRALHAKHGPIAVVHFDAHLDTWDTYFGADVTHGTPFRRAAEEGLLDAEACVHVGTRGPLYGASDLLDDAALGFQIIPASRFDDEGSRGIVERVRQRVGERPVYASVDIDVLDPAYAPGTGTPEAGGLHSRELLTVLRAFADLNLVGADVVEVAPAYDHAQITATAASHVIYEFVSAIASRMERR